MIEYTYNQTEGRWEFIYAKDGKATSAYIPDKYSEEEKIKCLTEWFNLILKL